MYWRKTARADAGVKVDIEIHRESRMSLRVVRLGSPRATDEGTRIGTARRPPRGVPKSQFAAQIGCYCEDESHCHRSILRQLLVDCGAKLE